MGDLRSSVPKKVVLHFLMRNPELHQNSKESEFWIKCLVALLLVIWSPWVNGFTFVLFCCVLSVPSVHFLSLRTCQFLFGIFPHSSQDNAWDYDPAAQVWGCRDSGGCSYNCHWGGSGKSSHFSGNARSDSTNPSTHTFLSLAEKPEIKADKEFYVQISRFTQTLG